MSGSLAQGQMKKQATRGRLTERAYVFVREEILKGAWPVGAVLAEDDLAARIGISRTPLRHALQLLLQEGFLEVGPRRQLVVRDLAEHLDEIVLLREALEGVALRRACEMMSVEEIDLLRLLLMRQRRAAEASAEDDFIGLDEEFHLAIADGAKLPLVHGFLIQLRGFVRLMRVGTKRHPGNLMAVLREHEAIVDALERRDVEGALATLTTHLHTRDYDRLGKASREGNRAREGKTGG
jgi:GntR family transcriptional regulator, rspAB operon transcriptional repressor